MILKKIFQLIDKNSLFLLILLIFSNESLLFGTNINKNFVALQWIVLFLIFIILFLKIFLKRKLEKRTFAICIVFTILSLLGGLLIDNSEFIRCLYEIIIIFIAMMYTNLVSYSFFCNSYINAMILISIFSWIPYLINIFIPSISSKFPIIVSTAKCRFYNMFIGVVPINENYNSIYRNYSFFREPGVFAVFIFFAMILVIFSDKFKEKKIWILLLLFITIISTLSTAGTIISLFLLLLYLILEKKHSKKLISFVAFSIIVFIVFNSTNISSRIFGKLFVENNPSTMSRINSFSSNFMIGIENPVLGVGWGNINTKFQDKSYELLGSPMKYGENSFHNTNTFLRLLSTHGILYFVIFCIGMYGFVFKFSKKTSLCFILFLLIILATSNENLTLNVFIYIFMMYGYLTYTKLRGIV